MLDDEDLSEDYDSDDYYIDFDDANRYRILETE